MVVVLAICSLDLMCLLYGFDHIIFIFTIFIAKNKKQKAKSKRVAFDGCDFESVFVAKLRAWAVGLF